MGPPRSKKRRPSFRKLLKTSGVKLENKLKNKTFKQENAAKKQRKEQKRLRKALKSAANSKPQELHTFAKRPDEEEEEQFLEELPSDMLEEEDLQMKDGPDRPRRRSRVAPVHSTKKRKSELLRNLEKIPRKMSRTEEKEVIHLLPIKDKKGVIPQSVERVIKREEEEESEEEEEEPQQEQEVTDQSGADMSPEHREQRLTERKQQMAALASAVIADPHNSIKCLKELRSLLSEPDPSIAVTVKKLVMVSLMEVFKDVAPSYKIRPLSTTEKSAKVKKETQALREFEEGLLSQYKFYLEDLEQIITDWRGSRTKRVQTVSLDSYRGLALVSVKCLCELLLHLSHFNFHNNIIVALVPLMNHQDQQVSDLVCGAFRALFVQDKVGGASLAAVRVISGLVKSHNYELKPEVLQTLLSLRIKEVQMKKDLEETAPKHRSMKKKEKKNLSRMERKWKKAEEKLQKELLEAEATESKEKKLKLHTEVLNVIFVIYFRILKKAQKSVLLPVVLEGLAHFAHLINLEFFDDLVTVLQQLIQSGELSNRESLHCIQTVFTILSGQGDVLTIDPLKFYSQLYSVLLQLHAGSSNDDVQIALRCVDTMFPRRRKHVSLQRVMSYLKRLSTLSLHTLPNASIAILATNRTLLQTFPRCDALLDTEVQGSGCFLPELNEPEHCHAHNATLWELRPLQRHFHPTVQTLASHLSHGAPTEGSKALSAELSRRPPEDLFEDFSIKDMSFNPPVSSQSAGRRKQEHFGVGNSFLSKDLQKLIDDVLTSPCKWAEPSPADRAESGFT
ncbi:nucleolar complex protein 3 homolog [Boleophthalmus pectinirostris]|uniref:nucleolar complex protein 3 homolog n=1 Tax=Boleophthalmus pectinirostris TaxID=150288 RepID=UPI0024322FB1|nr:nucleolar complex protein 3 homolog [Boleophthalmus pectinirostris]